MSAIRPKNENRFANFDLCNKYIWLFVPQGELGIQSNTMKINHDTIKTNNDKLLRDHLRFSRNIERNTRPVSRLRKLNESRFGACDDETLRIRGLGMLGRY